MCVCAPVSNIHTHAHIRESESERESERRERERTRPEPLKDLATHTESAARHVRAAPKDNPHEYRARIIPVQGRVYGPLSVPYAYTRTRGTHTRIVDDGSYKRAVERLPGAGGRRGGLWQSTQGLEAKRLIPQEALHPVLIRREFYERFERYCACVLACVFVLGRNARSTLKVVSARYWPARKRSGTRRALSREWWKNDEKTRRIGLLDAETGPTKQCQNKSGETKLRKKLPTEWTTKLFGLFN